MMTKCDESAPDGVPLQFSFFPFFQPKKSHGVMFTFLQKEVQGKYLLCKRYHLQLKLQPLDLSVNTNQCPQWTRGDASKLCSKHSKINRVNPRVLPRLMCALRYVPLCHCDGAVSNISFSNSSVPPCESIVTPKAASRNPLHCPDVCSKTCFDGL